MSSINPIHHQCDLPSSHNNIPVDIDKIVSISRLSHLVGFNVYSLEKRIFVLISQTPDKSWKRDNRCSARNNFGTNLWTSAPNVNFGTEFH